MEENGSKWVFLFVQPRNGSLGSFNGASIFLLIIDLGFFKNSWSRDKLLERLSEEDGGMSLNEGFHPSIYTRNQPWRPRRLRGQLGQNVHQLEDDDGGKAT
ncbi:hypothetical protein Tco_0327397 [Tanacetum coccineum]